MRVGKKYFSLGKAFTCKRLIKRIASFLAVTLFLANLASIGYAQDTAPVYTINTDNLTVKAASETEQREVNFALNDLDNSKMLRYSPKSEEIKLTDYRDFSTGYQMPGPYPGTSSGGGGGGGSITAGEALFMIILVWTPILLAIGASGGF